MSDHSEDGECSSSPKRVEIEALDNGCFVLDRNDDAVDEGDILLNTSETQPKEEANGDDNDRDTSQHHHKTANWLNSAMVSVMTPNEEKPKTGETKKKDNRRKQQCFNCGGDHNMTSCTEPRNYRRIRENREAFQEARSKDSRYTEPQSGSNGEFKPGRLSDKLQRALGIGPNDIPEFVYRMRRMGMAKGYPPGYLKNALVQQTNPDDLLHFHSDCPDLKVEKEAGSVRPLSPTVDAQKVIYYFGFNQTYPALRDKENYRIPPFNDFVSFLNEHAKKEFWEEKKREGRKRKASPIQRDDNEEKRARAEEDEDCMILEAPPPPPIIELSEVEEKKEEEEEESGETSLNQSCEDLSTDGTPKSRRISVGTPVLQRKNLGAGMKKVPSLDAFAKGIVPFQVDEPTPQTGFLKKMLKKIKDKLG